MLRRFIQCLYLIFLFSPLSAWASVTATYSWEIDLSKIAQSLTGPVAYFLVLIAIAISGLTIAFCDLQGGAKKLLEVSLGASVAFFAAQIVTTFLSFNGAVV